MVPVMDGNHGLKLECQSVTIVSALQGTRTSSKLFKVEHRVPPRVRKSRNRATCHSKNRTFLGLSVTFRCWAYPSRKASPHHDGDNRYVAYSEYLGPFCIKRTRYIMLGVEVQLLVIWAQDQGSEYRYEELQEFRCSIVAMAEGQGESQ